MVVPNMEQVKYIKDLTGCKRHLLVDTLGLVLLVQGHRTHVAWARC